MRENIKYYTLDELENGITEVSYVRIYVLWDWGQPEKYIRNTYCFRDLKSAMHRFDSIRKNSSDWDKLELFEEIVIPVEGNKLSDGLVQTSTKILDRINI